MFNISDYVVDKFTTEPKITFKVASEDLNPEAVEEVNQSIFYNLSYARSTIRCDDFQMNIRKKTIVIIIIYTYYYLLKQNNTLS